MKKEVIAKKNLNKKFIAHTSLDSNIAIVKLFPGMPHSMLWQVIKTNGLKALKLNRRNAKSSLGGDCQIPVDASPADSG